MIRQPIIAVMGHVDHGKTTLLDKVRNSAVAAKEAGGITQHIGASEVGIEQIRKICGKILSASNLNITIPGLLFIDTPGHEAFTSLRVRGGSIADIAMLVVDVTKGFEPQTLEAIEILKGYKTPFVVVANKIDLITGWRVNKTNSFMESLAMQSDSIKSEIDARIYEIVGKLSEHGMNCELFSRVKDFNKEVAIIPISAKTGEGIAELLMVVTGLAQRFLEARLKIEISGRAKGTILEKREIKGLGTTIDIILYDGTLHSNDTIAFATPKGVGTAKIRAMLKPKGNAPGDSASGYGYVNEVSAAAGIKISGNGLEDAIAGSPIIDTSSEDYESEIKSNIGEVFSTDSKGAILKADSVGSIDAISKLFKGAGLFISKKDIGNVTKRDVIDAFTMSASDPAGTAIVAFNVKLDKEAQEAADMCRVSIISGDIIYKLLDEYKAFVDQKQKISTQALEDRITYPGSLNVLIGSCFRASHPAIFGVEVTQGRIKPGYRLMNSKGEVVGRIKGIQNEKTPIESAKRGDRVAIAVNDATFGRQIDENDVLYSYVTKDDARLLNGECTYLINEDERKLLGVITNIIKSASSL